MIPDTMLYCLQEIEQVGSLILNSNLNLVQGARVCAIAPWAKALLYQALTSHKCLITGEIGEISPVSRASAAGKQAYCTQVQCSWNLESLDLNPKESPKLRCYCIL